MRAKWFPLLLIAAALLAYCNGFSGSFLFDDELWVQGSSRTPASPLGTRPAVYASLLLNYRLGGVNVWGYHAFNVAAHILCGLLLFGVVRRTLSGPALSARFGAKAPALALAAALLWLVHPLQTQSVNYIVQRSEILMALGYLLALYALIRRAEGGPAPWSAAAAAACWFGAASKSVIVTAPVLLLLYDRIFLAGSFRQALRRRPGLYAGLFSSWLLIGLLLSRTTNLSTSAGFGLPGVTPLDYALTQPGVILHYLRLSIWPHPLVFDYGWPLAASAREAAPAAAAVCALAAATAGLLARRPEAGFLGAWFFLILSPTSSFMPLADPAFEYRMYLPLAALIVGAVIAGDRLLGNRRAAALLLAAAAAASIAATVSRNADYRSQAAIWADTLRKRPSNPRAYNNLGVAIGRRGKAAEAEALFRTAIQLNPDYADAHNNLGNLLFEAGRHQEAAGAYERAIRLQPGFAEAHSNLGLLLAQQGRMPEAFDLFRESLRLEPNAAQLYVNLGIALSQQRQYEEAARHFASALKLDPWQAPAHSQWGRMLLEQRRWKEAAGHLSQAVGIDPEPAEDWYNLGIALAELGRRAEAASAYARALERNPRHADAHVNLGNLLFKSGRLDQAAAHYLQALELDPAHRNAHYNLGLAYLQMGRGPEAEPHFRASGKPAPQGRR